MFLSLSFFLYLLSKPGYPYLFSPTLSILNSLFSSPPPLLFLFFLPLCHSSIIVDFPHLSAELSLSSNSHDLFEELGVSVLSPAPSPSSVLDHLVMVESESIPSILEVSSDESGNDCNILDSLCAPLMESHIQDILKTAHHFSQQDRVEAVAERKKNQDLFLFISTLGLSIKDVKDFICVHSMCSIDFPKEMLDTLTTLNLWYARNSGTANVGMPSSNPSCLGSKHSDQALDKVLKKGEVSPLQPSSSNAKTWSSLVASGVFSSPLNLSFHPPSPPASDFDSIKILPPLEVLKKGADNWSTSLIGHFLHSKLPFKVVELAAMQMWGNFGLHKVLLHEKGCYIFKFKESSDSDNVIALGPWYISNRLIKLQHWSGSANLL